VLATETTERKKLASDKSNALLLSKLIEQLLKFALLLENGKLRLLIFLAYC
jgi:hypothetical protein